MADEQQAWFEVDTFLTEQLVPTDTVLDATLAASRAAGLPQIELAPNQAKLLWLLCRMIGARRVLEIGTLGGYSAIWLARAVGDDGRVTTLEVNPRHAEVARANLDLAGLGDRVEVVVGPAIETLQQFTAAAAEPFDLVFIDADKRSNPGYLQAALELTRSGSVIVVDNVVRRGAITDPTNTEDNVVGTRAMLTMMGADPRLDATALQTVGARGWDGFALAVVRSAPGL